MAPLQNKCAACADDNLVPWLPNGSSFIRMVAIVAAKYEKKWRFSWKLTPTLKYTEQGLLKAVKNKRRGKLSQGIVLLQDNARHHKARTTQGLLRSFGWEVLQHPPCSSDLDPCNFHVFGKLKEHLGGRQFSNYDQVETAVLSWLQD
ncbi:hypothetical protein AVEN_26591-1 [Araneus ventricosus]|uniref:Tc1-like transposase DDE domain-containing protein n=1 Tax=Araneus ventricosus TaxID=182803 RepID=A0A4Y2WKF2_ARAVE|nr:hypothetical protein AVEN_86526-1 [Araneus ventricosus]GBO37168.1 hypothetical protein AVEN_26591-1 [Araneus ventricosus]